MRTIKIQKNICASVLLTSVVVALSGCQQKSTSVKTSHEQALAATNTTIYVQASEGSYNHQAVSLLSKEEGKSNIQYSFAGTPLNTFAEAANANTEAFVALRNDIIPGHFVAATIDAFKYYKPKAVTGGVNLPIEMCLLRTKASIDKGVPLKRIASHPAALAQINHWKANKDLTELPLPEGTAAAARDVANGTLSADTGAIGACMLDQLYPALTVVERNIQDSDNNHTFFGRLTVEKRPEVVSEAEAKQALAKVVKQAKQQTPVSLL
ncbi:prephenate dehydratase domain-containing protein [Candidatus Sororendozoicomonas aggregata]|uniref:prephenate dehydratase domain-containing protein n=1 Tax=Candidatus Sororendozoicomonas aggregata TaxID=3073239 RepID=UPI002ED6A41D